ncbi:MAG: S-layer homology domain-containing protein, partial [Clostridia bacterium]
MKRKLITFLLAVLMLLSCGSVWAESAYYEKALFDITSLGIFIPDGAGEYRTEDLLTRAEFATVILRMTGNGGLAMEHTGRFPDVQPEHWFCGAVEAVAAMDIMAGDDLGHFRPDDYVSLEEAVKTLVVVLGYAVPANRAGGYPGGFMKQAAQLQLFKNFDMGDQLLRGDLAVLVYNALDVRVMVERYGEDKGHVISEDTYRNLLMQYGHQSVYKQNGIVTATAYSYTEFPISNLRDDEVVIGNVKYHVGHTDAQAYLGMAVDFYCRENDEGTLTLISVMPAKTNEVLVLKPEQLLGCTTTALQYLNEKERTDSLSIEGACVLKNGMPVTTAAEAVNGVVNGSVTAIDNDADGDVEMLFVESYENALVRSVTDRVISFYEGFTVAGEKRISVKENDDRVKYYFMNAAGETIELADIQPEQLISVYADEGKSRYKIYVSDQSVTGQLTMVAENSIMIDGTEYATSRDCVLQCSAGDNVTAYMDYSGQVSFVEEKESVQDYGYIAGVQAGTLSTAKVRLIVGKTVSFTADVDAEDADNVTTTPVLICENEALMVVDAAQNVRINGRRLTGRDMIQALSTMGAVAFTLNTDGQLSAVDELVMYGGHPVTKLKYNVYDKTFGGNSFITGFALDEKTKIVCIPESPNASTDDYLVRNRIDVSGNTEGYLVQGYDYDERTKKVGLVVVTRGMDAELIQDAKETSSVASMVLDVSRVWNAESETAGYKLTLLERGEEVSYEAVEVRAGNSVIATLK